MTKTNVMRILEAAGVLYKPHYYDESIVDGIGVANALGENPEVVFKTLVCSSASGAHYVFCIPVVNELNLKLAAKAVNEKSVSLIHLKELLPLTGYLHGGCSPIGLKKQFPLVVDETALLFSSFSISGGKRGTQVEIDPLSLKSLVGASFFSLT